MTSDGVRREAAAGQRGDGASAAAGGAAGAGETSDAFLGDRLMLLQPERGYRAGVDAVLLAAAVTCGDDNGELRALDAGAGVGTVGLCLARRCPGADVSLIEKQALLAALARRNIAANQLAERARMVEADLLDVGALRAGGVARESFDVVLANPPYHAEGAGTSSANAVKAAAHAMPAGALDDWMRALAHLCRPGGRAYVIHRSDGLAALLGAMQRRFGGVEIVPVQPRAGEPAIRVIVRGVKGSRASLVLRPAFVLHDDDTRFSARAEAVLRHGAALDVWG